MAANTSSLLSVLKNFANQISTSLKSKTAGNEEEQLKFPVKVLLESFHGITNANILCKPESPIPGTGRPDFAVEVNGLLNGYVELKKPGEDIRAGHLKGRNKTQWEKFSKAIPNLIYTNGNDWILYREGKQYGDFVTFSRDIVKDGSGAITQADAASLEKLLRSFLNWTPLVPKTPRMLAQMLAPLCHILKEDVLHALADNQSKLPQVAAQWRDLLFPHATDEEFADAYAQTLTYALLLAKFEGATSLATSDARSTLQSGHGLMGAALGLLDDPNVASEIRVGTDLLRRSISQVESTTLDTSKSDPWLYFYEDFLSVYDKKLRDKRGVYYTPAQVVKTQVNLVGELLKARLGKELAYVDDDVTVLDPATGTGTYPLAVLEHAFDTLKKRGGGSGRAQGRLGGVAKRIFAFELLVGPYSVAHLRMAQRVNVKSSRTSSRGTEGTPSKNINIYLTDTLESPNAEPPDQIPGLFIQSALGEEQRSALNVKSSEEVLVCIGNPPYDREQSSNEDDDETEITIGGKKRRKGGWIRYGDDGNVKNTLLQDFIRPAQDYGNGKHVKNLYNDYVYFWRWALWKVFEQQEKPGIVSFITASSFLRGPGFIGMRKMMRETFDEIWIIDLEGDNLGARKTQNVFKIQTPVAITIGIRTGLKDKTKSVKVRYTKLEGTSKEKLDVLDGIEKFSDLVWEDCFDGWEDIFLPDRAGKYFSMPLLTDVFPWQHSGVQMKRSWPISESEEVLEKRWKELLASSDRATAFVETRDRKISKQYPTGTPSKTTIALSNLPEDCIAPPITRYSFRSYDRQWVIQDTRLGDFMRPVLWQSHSSKQMYLSSMTTKVLGDGPSVVSVSDVPDMDHFSGRGGKDVVPLYRDAAANEPNITAGILDILSKEYGYKVEPEDLFAYTCAVLGNREYVRMYWDELSIPGPRLPLTKDGKLFGEGVRLGKHLIRLQTYGERFLPKDENEKVAFGRAENNSTVLLGADLPEKFVYNPDKETIYVDKVEDGNEFIEGVSENVWEYEISGLKVVSSWLGYRKRTRHGKKSSPLDETRPIEWSEDNTDELLELLWTLESVVDQETELEKLLIAVAQSSLFSSTDFEQPLEEERKPPKERGNTTITQEELNLLSDTSN